MVAIVTKTTVRPSTSVPFSQPFLGYENGLGTWPGWISGHTTFSADRLTKTRISYWETAEHYNNPTLTEAQILWNEKNMKWYKDNDIVVTITIDSLD
jgi:hypothetical protein